MDDTDFEALLSQCVDNEVKTNEDSGMLLPHTNSLPICIEITDEKKQDIPSPPLRSDLLSPSKLDRSETCLVDEESSIIVQKQSRKILHNLLDWTYDLTNAVITILDVITVRIYHGWHTK